MAEGLARDIYGNAVSVCTAGTHPLPAVDESVVLAMKERGIDISHHVPKHMKDVVAGTVDLVVTLCAVKTDEALANYPNIMAVKHIQRELGDPLESLSGPRQKMRELRRVRDEIELLVLTLHPDLIVGHEKLAERDQLVALKPAKIAFFEKYLSVWVLLCMVTGSLIGYFVPDAGPQLKKAEIFRISVPIAVLLWIMIFPMLLQIDFAAFMSAAKNPGPIVLTTTVNFGIQPFTMYVVALVFFRYIYATIIPTDLANEYLAGCILLGGAPCTAMVFVWSLLVGGDAGYTLMQVAVNDVLVLVLYLPTMLLLLNASSIPIPYDTIAISVGLFIVAPLTMSIIVRTQALRHGGVERLNRVIEYCKPVTTVGLLATLVLIFIYQGRTIGNKPLHILLIAIPLTVQTVAIFALTYYLGYTVCMEPSVLAPAALISTSNFFELAVAIAISVYGADSGAALATVVGVLVEVPTMLVLVRVCKQLEPLLLQRGRDCETKCNGLRAFATCNQCTKPTTAEPGGDCNVVECS